MVDGDGSDSEMKKEPSMLACATDSQLEVFNVNIDNIPFRVGAVTSGLIFGSLWLATRRQTGGRPLSRRYWLTLGLGSFAVATPIYMVVGLKCLDELISRDRNLSVIDETAHSFGMYLRNRDRLRLELADLSTTPQPCYDGVAPIPHPVQRALLSTQRLWYTRGAYEETRRLLRAPFEGAHVSKEDSEICMRYFASRASAAYLDLLSVGFMAALPFFIFYEVYTWTSKRPGGRFSRLLSRLEGPVVFGGYGGLTLTRIFLNRWYLTQIRDRERVVRALESRVWGSAPP